MCAGLLGPRSYEVKVGDRTFIRNRRHLIKSKDVIVEEDAPETEQATQPESGETVPPQESSQPAEEERTPLPRSAGTTPVRTGTPPVRNGTLARAESRRSKQVTRCPGFYGPFVEH